MLTVFLLGIVFFWGFATYFLISSVFTKEIRSICSCLHGGMEA